MPDNLVNILKFFLVALIWLFFMRAMRAVWVESKIPPPRVVEPSPAAARSPVAARTGAPVATPVFGGGAQFTESAARSTILTVVEPPDMEGETYNLEGDESVIGRASGCAVSIPVDTFVSHLHARVFLRGSETWIEDLGSTNGTYVNGRRLASPIPLRSGDRLQVGHTTFSVSR